MINAAPLSWRSTLKEALGFRANRDLLPKLGLGPVCMLYQRGGMLTNTSKTWTQMTLKIKFPFLSTFFPHLSCVRMLGPLSLTLSLMLSLSLFSLTLLLCLTVCICSHLYLFFSPNFSLTPHTLSVCLSSLPFPRYPNPTHVSSVPGQLQWIASMGAGMSSSVTRQALSCNILQVCGEFQKESVAKEQG